MHRVNYRDLAGGCLVVAAGFYFLLSSYMYEVGTAGAMGPGYYPAVLAGIAILLGIGILVGSFRESVNLPAIEWRAAAFVLGSVAVFALGLTYAGFVPAIAGAVVVSSFARRRPSWRRILILAAISTAAVYLVFRVGLNLPTPAFRGVL